ncbi:MAG: AraC family transcriptional regulator [Bacteroidota bacterium]
MHAFDHPELLRCSLLAQRFGVCNTNLKAAFKSRYGLPVHMYIMQYRHEKICELMLQTNQSIKVIAIHAGYTELSNFSRDFTKMAGVSPTVYRQQNNKGTIPEDNIIKNESDKIMLSRLTARRTFR